MVFDFSDSTAVAKNAPNPDKTHISCISLPFSALEVMLW